MIVFFGISIYDFCLSGIVPCPFVLISTTDAAAQKSALAAGRNATSCEADEAPPSPRLMQVPEKKRNREMNESEPS